MWGRWLAALLVALSGFFSTLWRIARQLFHETAGALFLVFAVIGGAGVWRELKRGSAAWLIVVVAAFTFMMAVFAWASFRSARRLNEDRK